MTELGFHWPSLIVYLTNFLLLLGILYVFAYKKILAVLDQRTQKVKDSLEEAEQVRRDAATAQEEVRQQLEQSRHSNQEMIEQARQSAEKFREEEITKAKAEAEAFLDKAQKQINQQRETEIEEIRSQFADLAITAAEKVIERSLDRDAHQELIDQVISGHHPNTH